MSRFEQERIKFDENTKKHIPISYNFIYRFDKRGVIKKKGKAYYGVKVDLINTPQFYAWGHNKAISKILNLQNLKIKKTLVKNEK